jgi:NAD(P)H dehydrogenase (quinone)
MYAVMGITGNVGGAVARTLLAKGEKVQGNRMEF